MLSPLSRLAGPACAGMSARTLGRTNTPMHPTGSVLWLRDCDGLFPLLQLEGDNDTATEGWLTFASATRCEVFLVQAGAAEWSGGEAGVDQVLERVSKELGRTDIRAVRLLRVERPKQAHGRSFRAFRATQAEVKAVYSSLAGDGEATVAGTESVAAFQEAGGRVLIHPLASGAGERTAASADRPLAQDDALRQAQ